MAFCMWFYVARILIPYQIADSALRQRPRGNLSDLYPRWLGARELWYHGRNPYSAEVTREIQAGYYGRPLDPNRPNDPGDQQGFAYPVYVTFLLLPTLQLPFESIRIGFAWLLVALTSLSVFGWLRALGWRPGWEVKAAAILLAVGSFAGLQGVKLQQLSLVVAALLATCASLLAGGHLFVAGAVLAIATIKPQLVVILSAFLVCWALAQWRTRRNFLLGFFLTLMALFLGARWLLPGWLSDFWHALHQYQQYTGGLSRLEVLLGALPGKAVAIGIVVALGWVCLRTAQVSVDQRIFWVIFATVLVATVLVVPNFAPYNELLLLPAILLIAREFAEGNPSKALRATSGAAAFFLVWGWLAAFAMTIASLFLPAADVQRAWTVPLWSEFAITPSLLLPLAVLLAESWNAGHPETETLH
jgi:hypothetical protein